MRRPQHMTMKELIALPILSDNEWFAQSVPGYTFGGRVYGGAFEDHLGRAWGTILRSSGWVRYPLRRPGSETKTVLRSPVRRMMSSSFFRVFLGSPA